MQTTVTAQRLTDNVLWRRAASLTARGRAVNMPLSNLYRCEHSPIRAILFWVEMRGIPSFVSTHLVRHKIGIEHYVESNRDDRGGTGEENRLTPVNHGMLINAQALIEISKKRLCYKSHSKTIAVWSRVRNAIAIVDPDLARFMVPECVYRNGLCPELSECKPGLQKVLKAYDKPA